MAATYACLFPGLKHKAYIHTEAEAMLTTSGGLCIFDAMDGH